MKIKDVLTNEFQLRYEEENEHLLLYRIVDGYPSEFPIELRLSTLIDMGSGEASKWVCYY